MERRTLRQQLSRYFGSDFTVSSSRAVTLLFAVVATVLIVEFAITSDTSEVHGLLACGFFAVATLSLPVATRIPWLAVAMFVVGGAGHVVLVERVGIIILVLITLVGILGRFAAPRVLILALLVFFVWSIWLSHHVNGDFSYLPSIALFVLPMAAVGYVMNRLSSRLRDSRRANSELERRQQEIRELERDSLARDLHDVVAHQLTVISLVSGSRLRSTDHQKLQDALREINATSREALVELRTLLKVLRGAESDPLLFGPPHRNWTSMGLEEGVSHLKSTLQNLGFRVTAQTALGGVESVRTSTVESALRILQESCTNVAKHAERNSTVQLDVAATEGWLTLSVKSRMAASPVVPPKDEALSSQQGLLGMTERAKLLGGSARIGRSGDTWLVTASLPL